MKLLNLYQIQGINSEFFRLLFEFELTETESYFIFYWNFTQKFQVLRQPRNWLQDFLNSFEEHYNIQPQLLTTLLTNSDTNLRQFASYLVNEKELPIDLFIEMQNESD